MAECLFCKIVDGKIPANKVAESTNFIAFLDIAPNAPGHTLVVPKKHVTNVLEMPEYLGNEFIEFTQRVATAIMGATSAEGFNLVHNNGEAAGQVVFHAHFHVIPRKRADGIHTTMGPHLKPAPDELARMQAEIGKRLG